MKDKKIILSVDNLSKKYQDINSEIKALDHVNFIVNEKEFISIIGPSGCGKSTLLSILALIDKDYSGNVIYKKDLKVGYMLQTDSLFPWKNVLDNCLLGLKIKNELNEENKKHVISLLKKYGLEDFMDKYPNNLSGGMRQRVALIRTLATKPDILLLDEPFSALDYQTRLAVSDDVYNILKKEKKSAIMVTHDLAEAISMSDRVIVLSKRPSKIKKIYEINLTNKSTPIENRKAKEFSKYYEMIWKDIDFHV